MTQAKQGDTVEVHYIGKLDDGTVFDTSTGRDPLEFTIGEGQVIPGFEEAVVGMNPGESKTVKILSDEAYGPHYKELMATVEKSQFPEDMNPEVGDQLQLSDRQGRAIMATVTGTSEKTVTLDANHPLAGQDLIFDIELVAIA